MIRKPNRRTAVTALAGLAAAGVLLGTAACSPGSSSTSAAPSAAAAPSAPAAPQGKAGHHKAKGVAGKVTAENGDSWTVVNAKGKQFTVSITPQTAFGTKAAPADRSQFPVGTQIRARGAVAQGTVTATRITTAKAMAPGTSPSGGATPTAGAAAPTG
jgi:hypothetical protein